MLRWLRNSFLTGIIVATPVTVTVLLIYTFINFVDSTIKPLIPDRYNPETYLPFALPGMGLIIAVLGLTLLGALAANIFGRSLLAVGERIVNTMPLVRNIYGALKQLVETALGAQNNAFKDVVLVEYPMPGSYAVAFVASHGKGAIRQHVGKGKEEVIGVFVPTTPNPTSGFLLFVPRSKAIPLDISIEEAAKLIISFGLVTPDRLPEAASLASDSDAPGETPEPEPAEPAEPR
ncbi:MAG: hypothetical protein HLUCCA04_01795 [Oceanicaulis sp. HLUCCA04]|nr:MAG: hypothetical protein HLUCCA04_01795 [Oceanicaulis sp. HLUCCA04]